MKNKVRIVPAIPVGDSFPSGYYKLYYDYERELRNIDGDIDYPIESETECIAHLNRADNYIDNFIYYNDIPVGLVCYQNVDFLDDDLPPILYIDHFYIIPEFRRKGIGTDAIRTVLRPFKGYIVFLCGIKVNLPAISFWRHVLPLLGLKETKDERCYIERRPNDKSEYINFIYRC